MQIVRPDWLEGRDRLPAITIVTIVVTTRLATVNFTRSILRTGQRVRLRDVVRDRRRTAPVPA